jgi:hypothetical protein
MAKKKRKKKGLTAFAAIKVRSSLGEEWATLTLEMRAADLEEFLRRVAQDEMSGIPSGQLPEWNDYLFDLLSGAPIGRPSQNTHPLWSAYQEAKAEAPRLSKRQFLIEHYELNRRDERSIQAAKSKLKREERVAQTIEERRARALEWQRQFDEAAQSLGVWGRARKVT